MEILLKINNKKIAGPLFMLAMVCIFISCKKSTAPVNSKTFIKTFQSDTDAEAVTLEQLADGGFLIIANEGAGYPLMVRTDKAGNQVWQKKIQNLCFGGPFNPNTSVWDAFFRQDAGHFVTQFNGDCTYFDTLGNAGQNINLNTSYQTGFGLLTQTGPQSLLCSCDGNYSGNSTINKIYTLDNNLNLLHTDTIPDTKLGGKTLAFFANYLSTGGDFIISGQKFPRTVLNWYAPTKVFVARISKSGKVQETMIDTGNQRLNDQIAWSTNTADSGIIMLCVRSDVGTARYYPMVIKFDINMNVVWQMEYQVGTNQSELHNMTVCSDGGIILVGQIGNTAYQNNQPYILRIDKNGNKLWDKTFATAGNSVLYYARQLADGSYAFLGYTNGFGNEKLGSRILFIKTDANGNL